jgi:MFS transporter, PCFT/HCP family, solute carrier family 46 (folate transporter), member 1
MSQPSSDSENETEEVPTGQQQAAADYEQTPKTFSLEIALIVLYFANNLPATLIQNQILKQTCQSQGYNDSICNEISKNTNETKDVEEVLQPIVAEIFMTTNLVFTVSTALLSLFYGPFSDKFGRKIILNSICLGYTLTLSIFACIAYYSENIQHLTPWAYTIGYFPQIISGGWPSLLTAALSYVTDISDTSTRVFRIAIIEGIISCGVLFGNLICNFILPLTNAVIVFIISASSALLSMIIMMSCVKESMRVVEIATPCMKLKILFSPRHFIEMLTTCFKRRSFMERRILLSLIAMIVIIVLTDIGSSSVAYLFERQRFGWNLQQHNFYESFSIVISILGYLIGFSVLKKCFKLSDMALVFIGIISGIIQAFLKTFAFEGWQMYVISCIGSFNILLGPLFRTLISLTVPANEIGKVFAITTSFEALTSLIASPLYTIVYSKTLTFMPGAFFLITAIYYFVTLMLSIFVKIAQKKRENFIPYESIE